MPYAANADLPTSVKTNLPPAAQDIWRASFNDSFANADPGESREGDAMRTAWGAVQNAGFGKAPNGKWRKLKKGSEVTNFPAPGDTKAPVMANSEFARPPAQEAIDLAATWPRVWAIGASEDADGAWEALKAMDVEGGADGDFMRAREAWGRRNRPATSLKKTLEAYRWGVVLDVGLPAMRQKVAEAKDGDRERQDAVKGGVVPTGPRGAVVALVGASPTAIEVARGRPFVGPVGKTLEDEILSPLGLTRSDVFLAHAVPHHLTADGGVAREPTHEEMAHWRPWLQKELAEAKPKAVIALGTRARWALGHVDGVIAHPMFLRIHGANRSHRRALAKARGVISDARFFDGAGPGQGKPANQAVVKRDFSFIAKAVKKQIVYGIVLEPDTVDLQSDTVSVDEIERTAHLFLADVQSQRPGAGIGKSHTGNVLGLKTARVVESYLAPADFELGGQEVRKGTWVAAVHVADPAEWAKVESGEFNGFSIQGTGRRIPV